jgi:hypothetical protein
MDNQKKVLNKITTDFVNACKRNLEIDLQVNGNGGIVEKLIEAQLSGNMLELEMAKIKLDSLKNEYQNNLILVRKGVLTLGLLEKQDFALN